MRFFIAIEVSPEVAAQLSGAQKQLQTDNAKLTFTKSFHLTLKFLGEVMPAQSEEIKKRLQQIQFKKFTAQLNGTGVFPSENYVRVVWVGIEPSDVICDLQKKIDEALAGLFPKEKNFKAHLTLARVKTISDKKQFAEQVKKLRIEAVSFPVIQFKLIESQLRGKEGPLYTDAAVFPLL